MRRSVGRVATLIQHKTHQTRDEDMGTSVHSLAVSGSNADRAEMFPSCQIVRHIALVDCWASASGDGEVTGRPFSTGSWRRSRILFVSIASPGSLPVWRCCRLPSLGLGLYVLD